MPDVDDFLTLTCLELMRRAEKFAVQRENGAWKLTATWKDGQLDDAVIEAAKRQPPRQTIQPLAVAATSPFIGHPPPPPEPSVPLKKGT